MKKRVLSWLLAACLAVGMLPGTAWAAEGDGAESGGVTLKFDGKGTITGVDGFPVSVDIPAEINGIPVTAIGASAFYSYPTLQSISLPSTLETIDELAFWGCTKLSEINIPANVKSIGTAAFGKCTTLKSITIPHDVLSIGEKAFYGCTGLISATISDSVLSIQAATFEGCTSLTSITLPDNLSKIEASAFKDCTGLTSVKIPDKVTEIGDYAFQGCEKLASVEIPEGVKQIGADAFKNCGSLTQITIPGSVTQLGTAALSGCDKLEKIYYGSTPDNWENLRITTPTGNTKIYCEYTPAYTCNPSSLTAETSGATDVRISFSNTAFADPSVLSNVVKVINGTTGLAYNSCSPWAGNGVILHFSGQATGGTLEVTIVPEAFKYPPASNESVVITIPVTKGGTDVTVPTDPPDIPDPDIPDPVPPEPIDPTDPDNPAPPEVPDTPDPPDTPDTPDVPEPPAPSRPSSGGGGGRKPAPAKPATVSVDREVQTQEPPALVISGEGESEMQWIVKEGEFADWIDRLSLPEYAIDLYTVLCIGGDYDTLYDVLIEDDYYTFPDGAGDADGAGGTAEVESVLEVVSRLDTPYASGDNAFRAESFAPGFDTVDTTSGDRAIDYASLKEGDVVRTSTFNGIFVTSVPKDGNPDYDADLKAACTYAASSFQAFDRDHPEVFWLSGSSKLRMATATVQEGSKKRTETYIFFVLADKDGFTVRDRSYPDKEKIEADMARLESAVAAILQTVTATTPHEQAAQINRWLTEHNEYNTSQNLMALSNWPHECLSALLGSVGTDGPVCDGYSRAFKVLCGRLGIPCVLVDGYARSSAESAGEFHMWNSAQMVDGSWYGVDVTWNDPTVRGISGAKSGYEREDFLLVGADTTVFGLKFSVSHPPKNRAADGAVAFVNGPTLSMAAFNPLAAATAVPFADVPAGSWYYGAVEYVYGNGLMSGTGAVAFSPGQNTTRQQLWAVLARMDGQSLADMAAVREWAVESGLSDGSAPGAELTREQLVAMLWRAAGSPECGAGLEGFPDSGAVSGYAVEPMAWALENGVLSGMDGRLNPRGTATRAQLASIVARIAEAG